MSSKTTLTFEVTVADGNGGSVTDSVVVESNSSSPDPGRYDIDGDGTLELADPNAIIDAYNRG